jgi:hypothetical protein
MVCALTVRTLEPGTFDQFRAAFMEGMEQEPPEGWVRFNMVRNADRPDEVICFGFFDGTVEDLRAPAGREQYEAQMARIAPYVRSVGADGFYDVVEDKHVTRA